MTRVFVIILLMRGAGEPGVHPDGVPPRASAAAQASQRVEQVLPDRLERLERWLKAVDGHRPGEDDAALAEVAAWSKDDLSGLWVDANALVQIMRTWKLNRVSIGAVGQRGATDIRYTSAQMRRLHVLSCAAAGVVFDQPCMQVKAGDELDSDLLRLSSHARAARTAGDDNYLVRRGALLHADIEMMVPPPAWVATPPPVAAAFPKGYKRSGGLPASGPSVGPQRLRMDTTDGLGTDFGQQAIHWEVARMLLDAVKPLGEQRPAPERDDMVRQWYRATAAWMQFRESHDALHLDHARELFPDDPDILFLSGSQHETYAGPAIQSAVRTVVAPTGFASDVLSEHGELRRAEAFFRRALAQRPDAAETQLRLGRVLGRLGRHGDAVAELRQAVGALPAVDPPLRYYGELFLGAEEEALGRRDEARAAYEHAAALYPRAQSPFIALSQLAWRSGDRAGALRAIQQLFALPREAVDREDPWWAYHVAQVRNAEALLEDLRRPFLAETPQ